MFAFSRLPCDLYYLKSVWSYTAWTLANVRRAWCLHTYYTWINKEAKQGRIEEDGKTLKDDISHPVSLVELSHKVT